MSRQLSPGCWEYITNKPEQSSARKGTTVHRAIREQLSSEFKRRGYGPHISLTLPDASFDPYRDKSGLETGGKDQGRGEVDLAFRSLDGRVMLLAEVKPANWGGALGATQLKNYIDKGNSNEELKQLHGVRVFSPMLPERFPLPPVVYALGSAFEIRWCGPGIIFYKQVRTEKEEEEKKKQQSTKDALARQRATSAVGSATAQPGQLQILYSAPRSQPLQPWTPELLRRDMAAGTIPDGVYRDRYSATWPSGYSTHVVVWVQTSPFGKAYQYYQEFPSDPSFYQTFAKKRGLGDWQANLIRQTLTRYNDDLWSLIAPDPETGLPSSRSPDYAKQELRTIYDEILKGVLLGSALIARTGAGIGAINATARGTVRDSITQRGTARGALPTGPNPPEEPLPDWVNQAVQKGFDLARELQRQMQLTP